MSALMEQHLRWKGARERLWSAPPPPAKPRREGPISPFAREERERRIAAVERHREFLLEIAVEAFRSLPQWRRILNEVSAKHAISVQDITSLSRARPIMRARQELMYRMREEIRVLGAPMSFPEIARKLKLHDHTTALHGYRMHKKRMMEMADA